MTENRKYYYGISQHRPDGLSTIWIQAEPRFSQEEIPEKIEKLVEANLPDCKIMMTGVNDQVTTFIQVDKNTALSNLPQRGLEILVSPKCRKQVLDHMAKNWMGEWIQDEEKIKGSWEKKE